MKVAPDCTLPAAAKGYPSFLISNIFVYLSFYRIMAPHALPASSPVLYVNTAVRWFCRLWRRSL